MMRREFAISILLLFCIGVSISITSVDIINPPNATTINGTTKFISNVTSNATVINVTFRFENDTWNSEWYYGHNITDETDYYRISNIGSNIVVYGFIQNNLSSDSGYDYIVPFYNGSNSGIRNYFNNMTVAFEWIYPKTFPSNKIEENLVSICDVNSSNSGNEIVVSTNDRYFYQLDKDGNELFKSEVGSFDFIASGCSYNGSNGFMVTSNSAGNISVWDGNSGDYLCSSSAGATVQDIDIGNFSSGYSNEQIVADKNDGILVINPIDCSVIYSQSYSGISSISDIELIQIDSDGYDEIVAKDSRKLITIDNDLTELNRWSQDDILTKVDVGEIDSLSINKEIVSFSSGFVYILNNTLESIINITTTENIKFNSFGTITDIWGYSENEIVSINYGSYNHNTSILNLTYEPSMIIDPTFLDDDKWFTVRSLSFDSDGESDNDTILIYVDYNYSLNIISPTSSNKEQVSSNDLNITSRFDFLYGDSDVTSGVDIVNASIGGKTCDNTSLSYVGSSWQLNCTAPSGFVGSEDLYIEANYSYDGTAVESDISEDSIYYVEYTITEGDPEHDPIVLDEEVQWRREYEISNNGDVTFNNIMVTGNFWNVSNNITLYDQNGYEVIPYQLNKSGGWLTWNISILYPYQTLEYTLTYITDPVSIQNRDDYYDGSYWNTTFDVVGVPNVPYEDIDIVIDAYDFLENIRVYETTNGDIEVTDNPLWYVDYIDYDGDLIDESVSFRLPYLNGNRTIKIEADRVVPVTYNYTENQRLVEIGTEQFVEWLRLYNFTSTATTEVTYSPKLVVPSEASRVVWNNNQSLSTLWDSTIGTYVQPTLTIGAGDSVLFNLSYYSPPVISFTRKIEPELYRTDESARIEVEIDVLNTGNKEVGNITKTVTIPYAEDASLYLEDVFVRRIGDIFGSYDLFIDSMEAGGELHYAIKYKLPVASVTSPYGTREEIYEGNVYDVHTYEVLGLSPISLNPVYFVTNELECMDVERGIIVSEWSDQVGTAMSWYCADNSSDILFKMGSLGAGDTFYVKIYEFLEEYEGGMTGGAVGAAGNVWESIVNFFIGIYDSIVKFIVQAFRIG